jgi:hypothetical protein
VISLIQKQCEGGECIQDFGGECGEQDIDDIECEAQLFDVPVKLGADTICGVACTDLACKVACDDVDATVCYTEDFAVCKLDCLAVSILDKHCVEQCEHLIVDPCKKILVDDCRKTCDKVFDTCHNLCENELTMQLTAKIEKLEHLVSSLEVSNLDLDCSGNAITKPLKLDMNVSTGINDLDVALQIHTKDAGIGTTVNLALEQLTVGLTVPVNGSIICGLRKDIDIHIGETTVDNFDLNFEINNKAFADIASIICLDLPLCKDAISDAIDDAIKLAIKEFTPPILARLVTPIVQGVVDKFLGSCPKIEPEDMPEFMQPELILA